MVVRIPSVIGASWLWSFDACCWCVWLLPIMSVVTAAVPNVLAMALRIAVIVFGYLIA